METNYELKHKCLLVPLKAALLVLAMVLLGFTTYAQSGKSVKVATDQQLIEAIGNPSVSTIEVAPGYYNHLNIGSTSGCKIAKGVTEDGNRAGGVCTYLIQDNKTCFDPDLDIEPYDGPLGSYDPPVGYNSLYASADVSNLSCLPLGSICCPDPDDGGLGYWSVSTQPGAIPPGATVVWDPTTPISQNFSKVFFVDKPGRYLLGYNWPSTNSYAFTEYFFYGPGDMELSAPPVCGTTTLVHFLLDPGYRMPSDPGLVTWTITGADGITLPYAGPTSTQDFNLTVPYCGVWEICVTYRVVLSPYDPITGYPEQYCYKTLCITVDFSCQPTADAGPDVNVCDDLCYYQLVGSTGLMEYSPTYAYSWVQTSGPGTLTFLNNNGVMVEETPVCREPYPPTCSYGEYDVEFQVQNGQCYSEDAMKLRFYQHPTANAGGDQHLCNDFGFDLNAVPFIYCGTAGVNYWSHTWWTLESQPDNCTVTFDALNPATPVTVTNCSPSPLVLTASMFSYGMNSM